MPAETKSGTKQALFAKAISPWQFETGPSEGACQALTTFIRRLHFEICSDSDLTNIGQSGKAYLCPPQEDKYTSPTWSCMPGLDLGLGNMRLVRHGMLVVLYIARADLRHLRLRQI